MTDEFDYLDEPQEKPKWVCQSCGFSDNKPMPKDREKYYANPKPRKCKSEDMVPEGF